MSSKAGESRNFLATAYLILTLVVFPAFALNEGLKHIKENELSLKVKSSSQELGKFVGNLRIHASDESFWLNRLTTDFSSSATPDEFFNRLTHLFQEYRIQAEMILYDGKGMYFKDNFLEHHPQQKAWKNAGELLRQVIGEPNSETKFAATSLLRPILGANFFIHLYREGDLCIPQSFYQTDFTQEEYKYWFARSNEMISVVRFRFAELRKSNGLLFFAKNFHKNEKVAIFRNNELVRSEIPEIEAKFFFNNLLLKLDQEYIATDSSIYCICQISNNIFALIKKDFDRSTIEPGKFTIAILLLFLCLFLILRQSQLIPGRFSDLPILGQISILMAISAGVPLVILAFVASGYFSSKRAALINEENQRMIEYFQQINENTRAEISRYSRHFKKTIKENSDFLRSDFNNSELGNLSEKFGINDRITGYLIKNDSFFYIKKKPIYETESKQREVTERELEKAHIARNVEQTNVKVISNHHLSYLNDKTPQPISLETSYIMEMFFQKSLPMIIHDFIKIEGNLSPAGWGREVIMLFIQSLKLTNSKFFDTYLVLSFTESIFETYFIRNHLNDILRNAQGYRIFLVYNDRILLNSGKSILDFPEIRDLVFKVSDYPLPEPVTQDFNGSPHIFVGLRGNKIKTVKFCILYPLEKIDQLIQQEAGDLAKLAGLAAGIVFFMVLTLYLNLLMPVNRLRQAAHALEIRDANFRLPEEGSDEFAEMSRIFNQSIAEFEELSIAGIVQNRLFPSKPLEIEGYSVYGKSLPMAMMGGDYFDYFKIDDNRFVTLLGDVAGHGVGASLIMAIAKAAIIAGKDVHSDPAAMLSRLHQIILATKTKQQRKVMTFQYMLTDRTQNSIVYANAGACSPALVDIKSRSVETIAQTSAVLGGFKKSLFNNLEFAIEPGQAIIFYTDGMVESRNESGTELGYEGLYQIFLNSFDSDAQKYYENIMKNFFSWLGKSDPGDDLTVLVTVCNNSSGI